MMRYLRRFFATIRKADRQQRRRISVILQKHGWHGFYALGAMLEDDVRNDIFQTYVASTIAITAKILAGFGGNSLDLPSYYEIMHPWEKAQDTRTGKEIRDDIAKKLLKGSANNESNDPDSQIST